MPKRKKSSVLKRSLANSNSNVVKATKKRRQNAQHDFADKLNTQALTNEKKKCGRRPPVPVLEEHRQASRAIARLLESDAQSRNGASVKSLTLAPHISNKKAVYALTMETLKKLPLLEILIEQAGLLPSDTLSESDGECDRNATMTKAVMMVLVREMLWGRGLQDSHAGPVEQRVLNAKGTLLQLSSTATTRHQGLQTYREEMLKVASRRPRTGRVNTLKLSLQEARIRLKKTLSKAVSVDSHLPDLLVFPPNTDLHDHPLVMDGSLILQSKASCIPAHVLSPQPGWTVLDACAAPGNKTTHLASLMQGRGKIVACDKDPKRLQRLKKNMSITGTDSLIEPRCIDFLSVDPSTHCDAILLDPSCSGSGTFLSRMDYLLPSAASQRDGEAWNLESEAAYSDERVKSLAFFQTAALRHALSFSSVQRIVYSTCSVYIEENEGVVASVLEEATALGFRLTRALPSWSRRGLRARGLDADDASMMLRTNPVEDDTDGFFVALFQRDKTIPNPQE
jgi:putative methyltransferase